MDSQCNQKSIDEILKRLKLLEKRTSKINDEINLLNQTLTEICTCNNVELVTYSEPGSYFDKSRTYEYTECKICGKRSEMKLIYTGDYE